MPEINEETIKSFRLMIRIALLGEIGSGKVLYPRILGIPCLMQMKK